MEKIMRVDNLKAAIVDWIVEAVMPSLGWGERIIMSLKIPVMADAASDQVGEMLKGTGLVSEGGDIDVDEALRRIREYAFRNTKAIPVRIGDTEIMLRMENIEEIANAARRME